MTPSPVAKERWRWCSFILAALACSTIAASAAVEPERRWIFWLGVSLLWASLLGDFFYRRAVNRYWDAVELERLQKHYPPGCTCIRGAMADNPSCPVPEHGDTL